jgi:hypothetical protein
MLSKGHWNVFSSFWASKMNLDEFLYVMFQVSNVTENSICLVNDLKCNFGDVDEAIFRNVERTFERIFYILSVQKSVLDEIAEVVLSMGMTLRFS